MMSLCVRLARIRRCPGRSTPICASTLEDAGAAVIGFQIVFDGTSPAFSGEHPVSGPAQQVHQAGLRARAG